LEKIEVDPNTLENNYDYLTYYLNNEEDEHNESLLSSRYFAYTLNKDGIISIEGYIFKLNLVEKNVYVINDDESIEDIQITIEASSKDDLTSKAQIYSFNDEIFGLLENRSNCEERFGCGEKCESANKDTHVCFYCVGGCENDDPPGSNDDLPSKILVTRYNTFGIFEELLFNFQGTLIEWHDLEWECKYKRKCKNTVEYDRAFFCSDDQNLLNENCYAVKSGWRTITMYKGSRCLSKYHLKVKLRAIASECPITQEFVYETGHAEIGFDF